MFQAVARALRGLPYSRAPLHVFTCAQCKGMGFLAVANCISESGCFIIERDEKKGKKKMKQLGEVNTGKSSNCRKAYAALGTCPTHIYCNTSNQGV